MTTTETGQIPQIDLEVALARVGGDLELLREVAGLFLDDYPRELARLRDAVASADANLVERCSHSLKGSVSNFGAPEVSSAALALEERGRAGTLDDAATMLLRLEDALRRLRPELESIGAE